MSVALYSALTISTLEPVVEFKRALILKKPRIHYRSIATGTLLFYIAGEIASG